VNKKTFIPSGSLLLLQIKNAETKFAAHRERMLCERAELARRINEAKLRPEREHNQRRYVYAGDRP
jgi:hypothetical protein